MTDGSLPDRLTQLRARWEADPASRVFLQLAEEYRHLGRLHEALAVLDAGLKEHPGYLSALVAKGRCHLELGQPEVAREVLERVVRQDATQMVANKLLVRAYLETGQPDRARERLDLYSLLHEGDPEVDELWGRIRRLNGNGAGASDSTGSTAATAATAAIDAARPAPGKPGDVFDLGPPPASPRTAAEDVFDLSRPAPAAQPAAPAGAPPAEPADDRPEPDPDGTLFPGLVSPAIRRRYLAGLAAEGIFALSLPPVAAAEPPAPAAAVPAPATLTLADLYLGQGHRQEAERIYEEVVRREPGNAVASEALARLRPPAAPAAAIPFPAGDLRSRKVGALKTYLQRLRGGSQLDVS